MTKYDDDYLLLILLKAKLQRANEMIENKRQHQEVLEKLKRKDNEEALRRIQKIKKQISGSSLQPPGSGTLLQFPNPYSSQKPKLLAAS